MKETLIRRRWDWFAAGLLVALIYTAAGRLSITNWTRTIGYAEILAGVGAMAGLGLGYSRLKHRTAWWLAIALTIIIVPWQMAHLVTRQSTIPGILGEEWSRLGDAFGQLASQKPVYDLIFFSAIIACLYWLIGLYCGYQLIRGTNILGILILPTFPTLIVQYYDGYDVNRIWIVAFYFVLILLLIGRLNILRNREKWENKRVFTGSEPEFDLSNTIFIVTAAIILITWVFPVPSAAIPDAVRLWQKINEPYDSVRSWINQTLDTLRNGPGDGFEAYGNDLSLGLRANQGTRTVFSVTPPKVDSPRFYWEMRIYDTYQDGVWSNSNNNWSKGFSPQEGDLAVFRGQAAQTASFDFRWKGDSSRLLAVPPQPLWTSHGGTIEYENAGPTQLDLTSWHAEPFLQAEDRYSVRSELINPTIYAMRNAGTHYPEWVTKRYLQLPGTFPEKIRTLAKDLASSQPTVYDKVETITEYLREQIKYSPSIAAAPPGTDPLEWFIFTWKSGYCNYYATSEVMMLRSIGIPARMAVGYAEGTREDDGTFTVRERDAHAWPEVFFPGIGWVDFEPTASQPALVRAVGSASEPGLSGQNGQGQTVSPPSSGPKNDEALQNSNTIFAYQTLGVWVIILTLVFFIGYAAWSSYRNNSFGRRLPKLMRNFYARHGLHIPVWLERWERWSTRSPVERSFEAINQSLVWLKHPQPPYVTPAERAANLKQLLPGMAKEIDILKEQHELTLFSPTPGDASKAAQAAWQIRYWTVRTIMQRILGARDE